MKITQIPRKESYDFSLFESNEDEMSKRKNLFLLEKYTLKIRPARERKFK